MVSIISIIGTFSIVIVFGTYFGFTLRSYLKNPARSKLFFMMSFISVSLTYFVWGLRVLIIPQFETDINILYPFWALAYAFGGTALVFLAFASLELTQKKFNIIKIIILVTYVGILILLVIGFEVALTIFMDVSDLTIVNQIVYISFTILILFYVIFPNAIFLNFLRKSPSKTTLAYKKVRTIELGVILWSIGFLLDGARFPSNIGILIARLITMIGGLIMIIGFFLMKKIE